jgi:DNA-binding response OmpR family regulator
VIEKRVLNTLLCNQGGYVSTWALADELYRDDEDGGPERADKQVYDAVRRLRDHGWNIQRIKARGYMIPWERNAQP